MARRRDVVIVGGGQAGLALGYELARRGVDFVILDAAPAVGHAWRARWDSLALFTPHPHNNLPGLPFPRGAGRYPTKDEVADYLEAYAATFGLPIEPHCRVTAVRPAADGYVVETEAGPFAARQVVIATGPFQSPYRPAWGDDLPAGVCQLHSSQYRNPAQLPPGDVLVVGAGNSGVQIAAELARDRPVALSMARRWPRLPRRLLDWRPFWPLYLRAARRITIDSPLGRWCSRRDLLFGAGPADLSRQYGVRLLGRALGVAGDRLVLAGGGLARPRSVIWATGFRHDYRWLAAPVCDRWGRPRHRRGVTAAPGLYFLGLFWQHWIGSSLLGGVGDDAAFLAARMVEHPPRPAHRDKAGLGTGRSGRSAPAGWCRGCS